MTNQTMHRQGDVLFIKVEALPEGLITRKSNIIVEGEVTGHAHRLTEGHVLETVAGLLFLHTATAASQVVHEEHHVIELEPGYWQVIRQREYSPEAIRLVMD